MYANILLISPLSFKRGIYFDEFFKSPDDFHGFLEVDFEMPVRFILVASSKDKGRVRE